MLCLFEDAQSCPLSVSISQKSLPLGLVWHHMSHRLTPTWFSATGLVQLHTTTLGVTPLALNPNCVTLSAGGSYNLLGSSVSQLEDAPYSDCVDWVPAIGHIRQTSRVPDAKSVSVPNLLLKKSVTLAIIK